VIRPFDFFRNDRRLSSKWRQAKKESSYPIFKVFVAGPSPSSQFFSEKRAKA